MKMKSRWALVFVFAFSFLVCQEVKAASITGKVVAVTDGDEITIFNLNRNARIKLLAIDAPEKDQAFGAAAKQHLFDLVYDKLVTVEYQGVGADGSLLGRVWSGGNDICAQMIRDGAAWFATGDQNLLTEEQREVYSQSEQAARAEKRGLWSTGNAVAPWVFIKTEALRRATTPTSAKETDNANEPPRQAKPVAGLDSMGLLRTGGGVARPSAALGEMSWADRTVARNWKRFQFPGAAFSVVIPDGGLKEEKDHAGENEDGWVSTYMVKEGDSAYQVIWIKGPTMGESDSDVLAAGLRSYLRGANNYLERVGLNAECQSSGVRNISLGDFKGREYDMSTCPVPHYLRLYTKSVNGERLIFGGLVVFKEENDNVSKFLKSFSLGAPRGVAQKAKSTN